MMATKEKSGRTGETDEVEDADVIVVAPEVEPLPPFPPTDHRLLDMPYQHEPETAGLDYAGVLEDDLPAPSGKSESSVGKTGGEKK